MVCIMTEQIATQAGEPACTALQRQANPRRRILVVEDDPDIRRINAMVLHYAGYHVDTAADGASGWSALKAGRYDVLITDNNMPRVTGMELIKKVRSEEMPLSVILASGTAPSEDLEQNPWLQLDAVLLKPYSAKAILDAVEGVLREADSPQVSGTLDLKENKIPQAEERAAKPVQYPASPPRRILVVDDDGDTRQLSVDVLTGSGYDVEGVNDGAAGWNSLQTFDYDLVITDNKMPRMTGVEMIGKLRSANMGVPVIMATRFLPIHEFASRPWLKPDASLERPFSNDDLLETVKKVLVEADGHPRPLSSVWRL